MNKLVLTSNMDGMDINEKKTKVMLVKKVSQEVNFNIIVNRHKLEQVKSFVYLGSIISYVNSYVKASLCYGGEVWTYSIGQNG